MKSNGEEFAQEGSEKQMPEKKEYYVPKLKIYGDVRSMTGGGAASTNSDSGKNNMSPN